MNGRVFLFISLFLTAFVVLSSPAVLSPWLKPTPTITPTPVVLTATPSPTVTRDPFADVPTATPYGQRGAIEVTQLMPTPALGDLPPTYTPSPSPTALSGLPTTIVLPSASTPAATVEMLRLADLVIPTPVGAMPDRVEIPALGLDAPVEAVGLMESDVAPGVFEWEVPDHRATGWLNTSAPFGLEGNTVLDGHHNVMGEVFKDLWTLRPGDEIRLWAGEGSRVYRVKEVLILPEKDQPLEVRLKNAQYLQPTGDERLTLITCWPYNNNTHRTVVIALPAH